MKIVNIQGREALDFYGNPALACDLSLDNDIRVSSIVSIDIDKNSKFNLQKSIEIINDKIFPSLMGKKIDPINLDLELIKLDGTDDKSNLGLSSIYAVSQCLFKVQAKIEDIELFELIALSCDYSQITLPIPIISLLEQQSYFNINNKIQNLIQSYKIIPYGSKSIKSAISRSLDLFKNTEKVLLKKFKTNISFGINGGYLADFENSIEPLDILFEALDKLKVAEDKMFAIALDIQANKFYDLKDDLYKIKTKKFNIEKMVEIYNNILDSYPVYLISNGFACKAIEKKELLTNLNKRVHLALDNLVLVNNDKMIKFIQQLGLDTVIVNPAKIGTVTEVLQIIKMLKENNILTVISDNYLNKVDNNFIVDLSIGANATHTDFGAINNSNINNYNRLLEIEDYLLNNN